MILSSPLVCSPNIQSADLHQKLYRKAILHKKTHNAEQKNPTIKISLQSSGFCAIF